METVEFVTSEDWSVNELRVFFHQLNILYNRLFVIENLTKATNVKLSTILDRSLSRIAEEKILSIDFIEIHSPARFSFKGVDKIIGQIRGLIKDFWYKNKMEKQKMELDIQRQRTKNEVEMSCANMELLKMQISIMKEAGIHEDEIRENIKKLINPLEKLSSIGQAKGIRLIEKEKQT